MRLRSLLFVPGDSDRKIAKAAQSKADGVIYDLEDAVAPPRKAHARETVAGLLTADALGVNAWVRVNALETGLMEADLAAVVRPGLVGVVLPKVNHASEAAQVSEHIGALEAALGMPAGEVRLLVVATETPQAMFNLGSYGVTPDRLVALTWGAEDLASALGAEANRETGGEWTAPYQLARSLCLFAAGAAQIAALDTLYADFRDGEGLADSCRLGRRDGFSGKLAIHPDQVETINAMFTPDAAALDEARAVVAAFAAKPNAGVIGLQGRMYDIPHLKQAHRVLAAAGATPGAERIC